MTRHPVDLLSLTFGLLLTAAGAVLLLGGGDRFALEWVGPAAVIGVGLALVLTARSRGSATEDAPATSDPADG